MTLRTILHAIAASGVDVSLADALAIALAIAEAPVTRVAAIDTVSRATGCGLRVARDAVDALRS